MNIIKGELQNNKGEIMYPHTSTIIVFDENGNTLSERLTEIEQSIPAEYTHPATHDISMITGLPTSLPADGGDSDTVDGKHADDFVLKTQIINTLTEGIEGNVLDATQGKVLNDKIDALVIPEEYTHPATHDVSMITGLPTSLPADGGDSDTVDGKHADDFILKTQIVNTLTEEVEGNVLDATQGKILNDSIIGIQNELNQNSLYYTAYKVNKDLPDNMPNKTCKISWQSQFIGVFKVYIMSSWWVSNSSGVKCKEFTIAPEINKLTQKSKYLINNMMSDEFSIGEIEEIEVNSFELKIKSNRPTSKNNLSVRVEFLSIYDHCIKEIKETLEISDFYSEESTITDTTNELAETHKTVYKDITKYANEDLNNNKFRKPGEYLGNYWVNAPDGYSTILGVLKVYEYQSDWICQELISISHKMKWIRYYYGGTSSWGDWDCFSTTTKTPVLLTPKAGYNIHLDESYRINNEIVFSFRIEKSDKTNFAKNSMLDVATHPYTLCYGMLTGYGNSLNGRVTGNVNNGLVRLNIDIDANILYVSGRATIVN